MKKHLYQNTQQTPIKMAKTETLITTNAGKDVERQKLSYIVGGMQKGTATLEDSLVASYKTKHTHTIRSSYHSHWYYTQMTWKLRSTQKPVFM